MSQPFYLNLGTNELQERIDKAYHILENCTLCPRKCKINRTNGKAGYCSMGKQLKISSFFAHNGEEPPISGKNGSGTVFFSGCTMECMFCQNYQISQLNGGKYISNEKLAGAFLSLQDQGCHNINLVTPTHWVPQILKSLKIAIEKGLSIPIIYNTNGYETVETLELLENIVDVYLPDMKYADNEASKKLSKVSDYVENNRKALIEMFRQVGNLKLDENGLVEKGLIVRHLILPENLSGTDKCLQFLHDTFGKEITISLLAQYTPIFKANENPEINRRLTPAEYKAAIQKLEELELENGWFQRLEELDMQFVFDFDKK